MPVLTRTLTTSWPGHAPLVETVVAIDSDGCMTLIAASSGALCTGWPVAALVPTAVANVSSSTVAITLADTTADWAGARSPTGTTSPSSATVTPLTGSSPVLVTR